MTLKVIGIGGCGCNIVNNICCKSTQDVDFALVNKDRISSYTSDIERLCVNADDKDLDNRLLTLLDENPKNLIVVTGIGGTYSAGMAARLCQPHRSTIGQNAQSVAFVVQPFRFETRDKKAAKDLALISTQASRIVTFDNNSLLQFENQPIGQVFRMVDQEVCNLIEAEKNSCLQTGMPY
jgi:cell division GTPase FtsZ